MKRLLLPLLAAIALPTVVSCFPFGNDLTIENAVGEKIIIKGETISSTENLNKNDLIDLIENKILTKKYFRSKEVSSSKEYEKDYFYYKDQCDTGNRNCSLMKQNKRAWEDTLSDIDEIEGQLSALENLKSSIIKDANNPNLIHIVSINFTPVYVDLNNQKRVGADEKIYCVNKALAKKKINYQQTWKDQSRSQEYEFIRKGLLWNEVCKKYAKF